MTPGARIQTSIELLETILSSSLPADQAMTSCFRKKRFVGSHDRREIAETVYAILRQQLILEWYLNSCKATPRLLMISYLLKIQKKTKEFLADIFSGKQYHPASLSFEETIGLKKILEASDELVPDSVRLNLPEWLLPYMKSAFGVNWENQVKALNQPASLDLRVNSLKSDVSAVLKQLSKEGIPAQKTLYSPYGIRLSHRRPLGQHDLWQKGLIEVQDEGSQLIALLTDVTPGMTVLDFCAGAGGKTLALAALMENKGKLVACDISAWRLERSRQRLKRAGVHNVETRVLDESSPKWLKRQAGKFDRVLVDAPCSGTGTWRRNPDLKGRLTLDDLSEVVEKQRQILSQAAFLVKEGGRLVYATCSVLQQENHQQVDWFLANHPDFSLQSVQDIWRARLRTEPPFSEDVMQLTPYSHGTDGFFVAVFKR